MTAVSTPSAPPPRLTSLSHGGGCGCKIAPSMLAELLKGSAPAAPFAQLLVGLESADDAAVYQLSGIPSAITANDILIICGTAMVICVLSAYIPARFAAMNPPITGTLPALSRG